jgi:hypothetical protein
MSFCHDELVAFGEVIKSSPLTAREIVAEMLISREVVDATGEERDVRLDFQKSLLTEAS